jgi:Carboxypeptidase regulatory-like domain/TonB-dependent Receptor Plug Domain
MRRISKRAYLFLFVIFIGFFGMVSPASAFGPTGTIVGTVVDSTGAAIPGAKVSLVNENTNEIRVATSDPSGNYTFPVAAIGNYTVRVEASGFQTYVQKSIVLQVDQNITIEAKMTIGASTQVVEVNGSQPTIDLVDATVSHVVDQQRIVDLPLNGRDSLQLQYVMPGVSYDNNNVAHGQGQHEGTVVNGNRPGSNYYLLDGVDMTDSYLSTAPVFPAPDALQEFDIQTSNFTSQYGRSSGGLVNTATRSGTNSFHGGIFEFFRNTVLDSHNFFDPAGADKPSFKLNQFGGFFGGPIIKDKTFFFGYYQGTRQRRDETNTVSTVLTQAQRPDLNGGVSYFPGAIDPLTNAPFPGGMIPANRIDPTALNFIKALMPLPNNSTGGYTFNAPVSDNLDDLNEDQYLARIDHNLTKKDLLFGHYFYNQDVSNGIGADNIPGLPHQKYFRNQNVAIDHTHTFSSNFINTAVFGFTRIAHHRGPTASLGWGDFGGPATTSTTGVPSDLYTSINGSVNAGGDGTFVQNRQTWQYTDYLNIVKGKHSTTIGGDFRREAMNRVEDYYTDPVFNFNGQYSGNALSDLLLGLPDYYNLQTEVSSRLRHNAFDLYAQDNYKLTQRVTIDAGIRWEPFLPPVDNLNDQICYDPTFTKTSSYYPTAPPGLLFPGPPTGESANGKGDDGCPRSMVPNRWKNVAPRIGVNVDPTGSGKTSIRLGYGIFWDQARLIAWNRFSTAQPFDESVIVNGPTVLAPSLSGNNIYTNSGVQNPYPFVIPRTPAQRTAFDPVYGGNWPTSAGETVLSPNFNEGYTNQWNATIDQQIARGYMLTVSYIGNHGTHLFQSRENNYAPLATYSFTIPGTPNPTANQIISYNNSNLPARRRLSNIQCGTGTVGVTGPCYGPMEILDPSLWSNYDSLQVSVNHRFEHGFSLLASYVWGKYLDVISYTAEGGSGPRDPNNYALSYGPSDNDVRHRFAASYIYELPKFHSLHGIAAALLNNWQNQSIITAQTGQPYSVNSSSDTAATGIGGETADFTGATTKPSGSRGVSAYFNTAAFQNAAPGTYGESSRNFLTGPSLVDVDFSLFKEFPIREKGKIQFRGEFFNLFNHPNFNNPDNTVGDGTFGQLTSTRSSGNLGPRIAQFALKYTF